MKQCYEDILSRIPDPPKWWDEEGVPRYDDFNPHMAANFYADEAALLLIQCQNCGEAFYVCVSNCLNDGGSSLATRIKNQTIHYGDPPNSGCCHSGPSMNSLPRQVLQYWKLSGSRRREWKRVASLEIVVRAEWDETKSVE